MTLRLAGSTSGYTEIDAPAVAGSNTLVLPTGNGSSQQVLATNGSGALSWSNRPILQVINAIKTDTFSSTDINFADITGLSASITPASASNKILVVVSLGLVAGGNIYTSGFRIVRNSTAIFVGDSAGSRPQATFRVMTHTGDNHGPGGLSFTGLDSPTTTSSVTYKLQVQCQGTSNPGTATYINRTPSDTNTSESYGGRTASTITLMEVAA
jgi:hypothetical protein